MGKYLSWFFQCGTLSQLMMKDTSVDSIQKATGYSFEMEKQAIYLSKDLLDFIPRNQWPEVQLPIPQAVPPAPPQTGASMELVRGLQGTHDSAVHLLHTQGIDLCKVFKENEADTVLANFRPKQTKCRFCDRVCKSKQKLKAHIRSKHFRDATFKCDICGRKFGEPYALSTCKKVHSSGGRKFLCAVCGKGFVNKSKLNEHTKYHALNRVTCAHCSTTVGDKKSLQDHLKVHSKHPGADQLMEEQKKLFKRYHCYHRYVHNKDLRRHMWARHLDKV